eukprot:TRINITY_DN44715_c0_g1_i1.p1 TRINITY_DN44715_c0_g1~~TRINITY_DN44715_c0_g1_i1.p1  ORF type:complete len:310 (+),score=79.65 TRINITY_DN44715_c0_g1_i1:241-1170(+)
MSAAPMEVEQPEPAAADPTAANESESAPMEDASPGEDKQVEATIRVVHGKETHHVDLSATDTVGDVKKELERRTNVPATNQKLMFKKKQLKDDAAVFCATYPLTPKDKLMLIGTPLADLAMAVVRPANVSAPKLDEVVKPKENIQEMSKHKKIVDKGPPDGAITGNAMAIEPLPDGGLHNIYNNMGNVARLSFKETEINISTKERTEKYPYASIANVQSEPVEDRRGYHIVSLQLGKNENSRYYLYYVPAQFVDAIRQIIMGGGMGPVSYTHLRAHETPEHLVCRLLLEKKKKNNSKHSYTNNSRNNNV